MATMTKNRFNPNKSVGKCYKAQHPTDNKVPTLFFKVKQYNKEKKCFIVEGFVNAPFCGLPLSTLFKNEMEKDIHFFDTVEEINEIEYSTTKENLLLIFN